MTDFPDEDRTTSPHTGWTRRHWEALADRMLTGIRPYASAEHSLVDLPGPASKSTSWSDGLEGFARTFLLAGFRLARSGDTDPLGLADWYARGLAAGTDPASPRRWPRQDEIPQAKVEAASIVIALHETRPWIWDRLDDGVRQRIVDWLAVTVGMPPASNNWVWFQGVVNAFLRSVGGPWSTVDIDAAVERTDRWYCGDGWYSDGIAQPGDPRNFDYYSGWAMHFYPLWFCRIAGDDAPADLGARYRRRLPAYLADVHHLVGGDGGPMFHGRSLTYRFAAATPFWVGTIFDATPLSPGQTRRVASGMLRYFLDRGCLEDGVLSIGWHGECHSIRQNYSGPGSPYWASKGFAGLVLPEDHPVWTDVEEPLPAEQGDFVRHIAIPGWTVSGTAADGVVRMAMHGGDHDVRIDGAGDDPFYCRHAYSTHAGPRLRGDDFRPLDSHVALVAGDGAVSRRRPLQRVGPGVSRHRAHWPDGSEGPWITTASVLRGAVEVRLARVEDEPAVPCTLRVGGYPVVPGGPVASAVIGLRGLPVAGSEVEGDNAFGTGARTPFVTTDGPVRAGEVHAAAVVLTGAGATAEGVTVSAEGRAVRVDWPDGTSDQVSM